MKKKITVIITTYERPKMLLILLKDIKKNKKQHDIELLIFNDNSKTNYSRVITYLNNNFKNKYQYYNIDEHQGKKGYWKIINLAYNKIRNYKFDYVIQIPDDIRLIDNFFSKSIDTFENITDPNKACLNLLNDGNRCFKPNWTNYKPHFVNYGKHTYIRTGWVDLCFISQNKFFEILNFEIPVINDYFAKTKNKSSGVGMYISQTIFNSGASLYQLVNSFVSHGTHKSQMHTELRKKYPLIAKL